MLLDNVVDVLKKNMPIRTKALTSTELDTYRYSRTDEERQNKRYTIISLNSAHRKEETTCIPMM